MSKTPDGVASSDLNDPDDNERRTLSRIRGGTSSRPAPVKPGPATKTITLEFSEADFAKFVDRVVLPLHMSAEDAATEIVRQFMLPEAEPAIAWMIAHRKASDSNALKPAGANVWESHDAAVCARVRNDLHADTELAGAFRSFIQHSTARK